MSKRFLKVTAAVLAAGLVLASCFIDPVDDVDTGEKSPPHGGDTPYSGTVNDSAQGFGGKVTVTLTLEKGYITKAEITGKDETPAYGGEAIKRAPAIIEAKNSVEIDTLSGASFTTRAIVEAGKKALEKIN